MKTNRPTDKIQKTDWYHHWWQNSPLFEIHVKGKSKPRTNAEFWYEHFWKPREVAVWIYEIVRRLPNTKISDPALTEANISIIKAMPPYTELPAVQKKILVGIINRVLNSDLIADELSVLFNTTDKTKLPKWQQGQPHMLPDWRQVEVMGKGFRHEQLDEEQNVEKQLFGEPLDDEQALVKKRTRNASISNELNQARDKRFEKRKRSRQHAMKFLPLVLAVWKTMNDKKADVLLLPALDNLSETKLDGSYIETAGLESLVNRGK